MKTRNFSFINTPTDVSMFVTDSCHPALKRR